MKFTFTVVHCVIIVVGELAGVKALFNVMRSPTSHHPSA